MWTWTYEAHEFTHDNDQVIALFSLSHPKEKNKKKKLILRDCFFFFAYERDVSFWRF